MPVAIWAVIERTRNDYPAIEFRKMRFGDKTHDH